jgi:hypothetical protein
MAVILGSAVLSCSFILSRPEDTASSAYVISGLITIHKQQTDAFHSLTSVTVNQCAVNPRAVRPTHRTYVIRHRRRWGFSIDDAVGRGRCMASKLATERFTSGSISHSRRCILVKDLLAAILAELICPDFDFDHRHSPGHFRCIIPAIALPAASPPSSARLFQGTCGGSSLRTRERSLHHKVVSSLEADRRRRRMPTNESMRQINTATTIRTTLYCNPNEKDRSSLVSS